MDIFDLLTFPSMSTSFPTMSVAPFPSMYTLYTVPRQTVVKPLGGDDFCAEWPNGSLKITLFYKTKQTNWYRFEATDDSSEIEVRHERNLLTGIITRYIYLKDRWNII